MCGIRLDVVDGDADPQPSAAPLRGAPLESDAKPVAPNLARGPVARDLLESEPLVESEAAVDVGDSQTQSRNCLYHLFTLRAAPICNREVSGFESPVSGPGSADGYRPTAP